MEDSKERNAWLSVPQFGDWDQKGALPDYSMDFSKIREMRKQNKRDPSRASLGNEAELISSSTKSSESVRLNNHHDYHKNHSPASIVKDKSTKNFLQSVCRQGGASLATSTAASRPDSFGALS